MSLTELQKPKAKEVMIKVKECLEKDPDLNIDYLAKQVTKEIFGKDDKDFYPVARAVANMIKKEKLEKEMKEREAEKKDEEKYNEIEEEENKKIFLKEALLLLDFLFFH